MKAILFCSALALVGFGCKKGSSASSCADAINKGVDTMMAAGAKRMENAPADQKAKMAEVGVKLKGVITNRCTEDKWSSEIVDCYANAKERSDLRNCRSKLSSEAATKLETEEREVTGTNGTTYQLRIRPYRTQDNKIDGAVLTLVDIDPIRRPHASIEYLSSAAMNAAENSGSCVFALDTALRIRAGSTAFRETFDLKHRWGGASRGRVQATV